MSDSDSEELFDLRRNSVVESNKARYIVEKLLGEGGFGAVFKVHEENDPSKQYAMKVEQKIDTRKHSKLKMEIAILKLVSVERQNSHFTKIIDRGKKETYFFLVMELVGKSLADLKQLQPEKVFSPSTAFGIALQCLEAVEDLHKYGFIHRDLKPANYACGLKEKQRIIYILDFGIARKIWNEKNELKAPRVQVRFKGTIQFAPLACHNNQELGPKDDCESWLYLLLDILIPFGLPWKRCSDKQEVKKLKEDCRKEREPLLKNFKCKEELGRLLDYFDSLHYHDRVDYEFAYNIVKECAKICGGDIDLPYDWERESL